MKKLKSYRHVKGRKTDAAVMEIKNNRDLPKEGMLYLCATPLGNLQDITLRVLDCLKTVDLIAAENVVHSRKLLHYYGIKTPLTAYRESNKRKKGQAILEKLKQGARVALISDAGMPIISDPGADLLDLLIAENIPFTVLPGPSAVLTALLLSGYAAGSAGKFVFEGFLSRNKGTLRKELAEIAREERAVVFYESPHRLQATLAEMAGILKDRPLAVCRELTKKFEEVQRGTAGALLRVFDEQTPRGEITVVISPQQTPRENSAFPLEACENSLRAALKKGKPPTEAVKSVAQKLALKRKDVYAVFINLKK